MTTKFEYVKLIEAILENVYPEKITSEEIEKKIIDLGYKINGEKLRKIIHHIRLYGILGIMSDREGYWLNKLDSKDEINEFYKVCDALEYRALKQLRAVHGLRYYAKEIQLEKLNNKNGK